MLKLNELNDDIIEWYLKEVKSKVDERIEQCKKIFEGNGQVQENPEILDFLNKLKKEEDEYLKKNPEIIINDTEKDEIKEITLEKDIEFSVNLEKLNISEEDPSKEQLNLLKKIFKIKTKEEKKEEYKLKWKHFLMYIFDYENILSSKRKGVTLRHRFLSKLNIKTCPYCGRQYITNYNESYSTADLDHFYSQSKYPYLALNIYNFIPACAVCNRNFKNDEEVEINPRVEEFGENAVFTLGNDISTYMDMGLEDIDIKLDIRTSDTFLAKRIEKNIDTFKLEEVYKLHSDYVLQMIKDITFRGNESYLESIKMLFEKDDENEVLKKLKELIKAPYEFRIRENEPLGKLTKDILNEIEKKLEMK